MVLEIIRNSHKIFSAVRTSVTPALALETRGQRIRVRRWQLSQGWSSIALPLQADGFTAAECLFHQACPSSTHPTTHGYETSPAWGDAFSLAAGPNATEEATAWGRQPPRPHSRPHFLTQGPERPLRLCEAVPRSDSGAIIMGFLHVVNRFSVTCGVVAHIFALRCH